MQQLFSLANAPCVWQGSTEFCFIYCMWYAQSQFDSLFIFREYTRIFRNRFFFFFFCLEKVHIVINIASIKNRFCWHSFGHQTEMQDLLQCTWWSSSVSFTGWLLSHWLTKAHDQRVKVALFPRASESCMQPLAWILINQASYCNISFS